MRLTFLKPFFHNGYGSEVYVIKCRNDYIILNLEKNDIYDVDIESAKYFINTLTNYNFSKINGTIIKKINENLKEKGFLIKKAIKLGGKKFVFIPKISNYLAIDYKENKYYKINSISEIPKIFEKVFGIKIDNEKFIKKFNEIKKEIKFNKKVYYCAWYASGLLKIDFQRICNYTDSALRSTARIISKSI